MKRTSGHKLMSILGSGLRGFAWSFNVCLRFYVIKMVKEGNWLSLLPAMTLDVLLKFLHTLHNNVVI